MVSTYADTNGSFRLKNAPCGPGWVPVVMQLGKWRQIRSHRRVASRQLTRSRRDCRAQPVNDNLQIAVVTGAVDTISVRKIGIATDQHSLPSGRG